MANITRNFIRGRMNKSLDERLVPQGEYIDALNVRLGSTEDSEIGAVENSKGNTLLTALSYNGVSLSLNAKCIGAFEDGANETLYWFVHDPRFTDGLSGELDLILSYNTNTNTLKYHVISINSGNNSNTTLDFNLSYLITGINLVDNLLFFTDNINPPRVIDITKNYPEPVNNLDQFSAESILVIKRPPVTSPTIQTLILPGLNENFLETRFISFSYRYQYANGEYSAISQFSKPAFDPGSFNLSTNSFLNEGMVNSANTAIVTYNSGGPLVVAIELLFKESTNTFIKVIEKFNKENLGYADDTDYSFTFSDSKIFTLLPESEILRLYDNVPRTAKSQTLMGNRLVYGNYLEGYNLVDRFNNNLKLEYVASLLSTSIGLEQLSTSTGVGVYNAPIGIGITDIENAVVYVDLTGITLSAGSAIDLSYTFTHNSWSNALDLPSSNTLNVGVSFEYILPTDFSNVYDLATSTDFIEKVGTVANIQTVPNASLGVTLTDFTNANIPQNLGGTHEKTMSGVNQFLGPLEIISTPGSNAIGFQTVGMNFSNTSTGIGAIEFYSIIQHEARFQKISNPGSLHSNRGYEVGLVYMDEFNRSTTALVSPQNTIQVPCLNSVNRNELKVTIPPQQLAPNWATRYKFVLKPSEDTYETIFVTTFFNDPTNNSVYYLLEGDNAGKVEEGDRLIVKRDSDGATQTCPVATVLEKKAQSSNFLTIPTGVNDADGNPINTPIPGGVYMKINPSNFNSTFEDNATVDLPYSQVRSPNGSDNYPLLKYNLSLVGADPNISGSTYNNYTIPEGSRITIDINQSRNGTSTCDTRIYNLKLTLTSSKTYLPSGNVPAIYNWFIGDNIAERLNDGTQTVINNTGSTPGNAAITNEVSTASFLPGYPGYNEGPADPGRVNTSFSFSTNYYFFYRNTTTNQVFLLITGTSSCGSSNDKRSFVNAQISILRAGDGLVFETQPLDSAPDIWYENDLSFPINNLGHHQGNLQNQSAGISAICNTGFFNCFSFGNGVESYKIRDAINGKPLGFGSRVTTTTNTLFKEANRFADLTYSGVYNDETNTNKLNEFNLGLLNFKPLEDTFGPIQKLFARETDILVLQEDKISYVLTGVNLLSDAVGGGVITAVPQVLGKQIARIEEFGISNNPESFAVWGRTKYFTDAKRGAVISLTGDRGQSEQLQVISEAGMRGWFRDLFIDSFNTQKIGGFDPYMNEYVLSSNIYGQPAVPEVCINCGIERDLTLTPNIPTNYCVDVTGFVGVVNVNYVIPIEGTDDISSESSSTNLVVTQLNSDDIVTESAFTGTGYTISIIYNGITYTTGEVFSSGTLSFNKDVVSVTEAQVSVSTSSLTPDNISVTVECPLSEILNVYNIAITSNNEATQTITNAYRWSDGNFDSTTKSEKVVFSSSSVNPIVSQYSLFGGPQGAGLIPANGANVTIISRKTSTDNYVFNTASNKLKYLRTSTLYQNTGAQIQSLLSVAQDASPITTGQIPGDFEASFLMPSTGTNLYLIWDYRKSTAKSLCFSDVSSSDACNGCVPVPVPVPVSPVPVATVYTWQISFLGTIASPANCPITNATLYSISSSFATTFVNSTVFYIDAALTTVYAGGNTYSGVREPNTGGGVSSAIFRFTSLGTVSNIDTSGVCSVAPIPVPVVIPVPIPIPVPVVAPVITPVPVPITPVPIPTPTPVAPIPTPIPVPVPVSFFYYTLRQCTTLQLFDVGVSGSLTLGTALNYAGQCWEVYATSLSGTSITPTSYHTNCSTCLTPTPVVPVPVPVSPTPIPVPVVPSPIPVPVVTPVVPIPVPIPAPVAPIPVPIPAPVVTPVAPIPVPIPVPVVPIPVPIPAPVVPIPAPIVPIPAPIVPIPAPIVPIPVPVPQPAPIVPIPVPVVPVPVPVVLPTPVPVFTPVPVPAPVAAVYASWYINNWEGQGVTVGGSGIATCCSYNTSSSLPVYLWYGGYGTNGINIKTVEDINTAISLSKQIIVTKTNAQPQAYDIFDGRDPTTNVSLLYGISRSADNGAPGIIVGINEGFTTTPAYLQDYVSCLQSFSMTTYTTSWTNTTDACSSGPSTGTSQYFHSGSTACLANSNVVYLNTDKYQTFPDVIPTTSKVWYQGSSCGSGNGLAIEINNSNGQASITSCT